jgi:hypothetical protein
MDDATLTELEIRKTSKMHLKPVLGPVQLIFYSVGVIIGAGVYSMLGAAAGLAQHSLWISFLVGAGIALLTAISLPKWRLRFRPRNRATRRSPPLCPIPPRPDLLYRSLVWQGPMRGATAEGANDE